MLSAARHRPERSVKLSKHMSLQRKGLFELSGGKSDQSSLRVSGLVIFP